MKKVKWIVFITMAVLLLATTLVNADNVDSQKDSLRAVKDSTFVVNVNVNVNVSDELAKFTRITKEKLKTDVELKFRIAGIRVLDDFDSIIEQNKEQYKVQPALLDVTVQGSQLDDPEHIIYIIYIEVETFAILMRYDEFETIRRSALIQSTSIKNICDNTKPMEKEQCEGFKEINTLLTTKTSIAKESVGCIATIWKDGGFGITSHEKIEDTIRGTTKDLVDKLLNDFLAVNPRQIGKEPKDDKASAPQTKGWQGGNNQ